VNIKKAVISFSSLGGRSRLGNHLFQYAFVRTTARKLGVRFYCPRWTGDGVFDLRDEAERADGPENIKRIYQEPTDCTGLNESALCITDGTEIRGYFQTEKYLLREQVCQWYSFKEQSIAQVRSRYKNVDFENSVGLSVRLGDFQTVYGDLFYVPRRSYYVRALELVQRRRSIVLFSDDVEGALSLLGNLGLPIIVAKDYEPYEGLYLQSRCRDFICSPSTYSWWGAWLNRYPDRIIVAPSEGPFRPGAPVTNGDYWPETWVKIPALRAGLDRYWPTKQRRLLQRALKRMERILSN
jgi:hypothetical protein